MHIPRRARGQMEQGNGRRGVPARELIHSLVPDCDGVM